MRNYQEMSYQQYRLIKKTERRVWLILFMFAVLFGGLLLFSIFGCKPLAVDEKFNSEIAILKGTCNQLAFSSAELGYTCAKANIPREEMRKLIKGVLDKEKEPTP